MSQNKLTPGAIVLLASGALVFIASFLHFYKGASAASDSGSVTAWSKGFRFLTTLPAIVSVLIIVFVLLAAFSHVRLPTGIAGLSMTQLVLVLSAWVALMMLCFLIGEAGVSLRGVTAGADKSVGFWLTLIGAIGLVVGAVMNLREPAAPASPAPQ